MNGVEHTWLQGGVGIVGSDGRGGVAEVTGFQRLGKPLGFQLLVHLNVSAQRLC